MFLSRLLPLPFLVALAAPVASHEFWIEPDQYQVPIGGTLQADFKNGQNFRGTTLGFFDRRSETYALIANDKRTELMPRAGDRPALNVPAPLADTLAVVIHETAPSTLTYKEWAKFLKFAEHKDFQSAAMDHAAAGWPMEGFKERYTRHAKSLIAVGSGAGADASTGMQTEFVALSNPYAPGFDGQMRVRVLYQGAVRPDAQVEVFDRARSGDVTVTLYRTNAQGEAVIPVSSGHSYIFDAVVLRPAADMVDPKTDPVWETLWAALTFAVP
jgi:uncharacterized protein DUF4198